MAIFGNNEAVDGLKIRYENLKEGAKEIDAQRKKLAAELAAEQQRSAQLVAELDMAKGEIEKARAAVRKARQRQKNSVARANRFKARIG